MRLLLTSSGISNKSIESALVGLLGKPIAESRALIIPTAAYGFRQGPGIAWGLISGKGKTPLCELGWKSLGVLELTALPSITEDTWLPNVRETDALLVGGGDVVYLSHWMRQSGLTDVFPSLRRELVYVGISAGSMAAASTFGETITHPHGGSGHVLTSEEIMLQTPEGVKFNVTCVTGQGAGLVDFSIFPHMDNKNHPDASLANIESWVGRLPGPTYAIDDQTAVKVTDENVEVVTEGSWKLLNA